MAGKGMRRQVDVFAGQAPEDPTPAAPLTPVPAQEQREEREQTVRVTVDFRKYAELRQLRTVAEEMAEETDRTSVPASAIIRALVNLTLADTDLRDRVITELRDHASTYFRQYGSK